VFYVVSGLLVLAVAISAGALLLRVLFRVRVWSPLLLQALLVLAFVVWVEHLWQLWNPVNWGGAIDYAGSWPGLTLFTVVSLGIALAVWVLGLRLASSLPLVAAILPLGWTLFYRWFVTGLLRWRAPADFYLEDDPYGMWLFIRMFVLTACLVVYALLLSTRSTHSAYTTRRT
jgi:hypothetical protein